jgi:monoterpene epsilon-lactone hydrolase
MASIEAARFNTRLVGWAKEAGEGGGPEAFRACSKRLFEGLGAPLPVAFEGVSSGTARAVYADEPGGLRAKSVLLFFHGGAFTCGSPETHARFAIQLGRRIGARALLVDYRLSPEYIFPTQIEDCAAVYAWLLSSGVDPARIAVAGESAGGNLCFTAILKALRQGLPAPAVIYAMSPWLDFDATGASYSANATADLVSGAEMTRIMSRMYLGPGVDSRDPVATPLYANLRGMPPVLVQVGGDEVLVDDARSVVARARSAGVIAELDIVPEMQHMYQFDAGVMPEADASYDRAAAFIGRFLRT